MSELNISVPAPWKKHAAEVEGELRKVNAVILAAKAQLYDMEREKARLENHLGSLLEPMAATAHPSVDTSKPMRWSQDRTTIECTALEEKK